MKIMEVFIVKKTLSLLFFLVLLTVSVLTAATKFTDVPINHWAYDAVQRITSIKILEGYPDNTFKGVSTVTRYELTLTVDRTISYIQEALLNPLTEKINELDKKIKNIPTTTSTPSKDYSGDIAVLKSDLSELTKRFDNMQTSLTDIRDLKNSYEILGYTVTKIKEVDTRLTTLESKVSGLELSNANSEELSNTKKTVDSILVQYSEMNNSIKSANSKISALETKLAALEKNNVTESFSEKLAMYDSKITLLETKTATIETKILNNDAKMTSIDTKMAGYDTKISSIDSKVSGHDTKISSHDSKLSTIEKIIAAHETKLSSYDSKFTANDSKIIALEGGLNALDARMSAIEKNTLTEDMSKVKDLLTNTNTKLDAKADKITVNAVESRLNTLEQSFQVFAVNGSETSKSIAAIKNDIAALTGKYDEMNKRVMDNTAATDSNTKNIESLTAKTNENSAKTDSLTAKLDESTLKLDQKIDSKVAELDSKITGVDTKWPGINFLDILLSVGLSVGIVYALNYFGVLK